MKFKNHSISDSTYTKPWNQEEVKVCFVMRGELRLLHEFKLDKKASTYQLFELLE
ncbi:MAG: hypothetical protein ACUZ8E_10115 [Candidatus Anammoxibacter sp.]